MLRLINLNSYVIEACEHLFRFFTSFACRKAIIDPMPSEAFMLLHIQLIDVLIKLEQLKEKKAAVLQDFQRYKKALGTKLTSEENDEVNTLQHFILNPDPTRARHTIFGMMKEQIKRVNGFDELLILLVELSQRIVETDTYVVPEEYFRHLRFLPYALVLLDGNVDDAKNNVFSHRKLKLSALQRLLRKHPVVPLTGDLSLTLLTVLDLAPHFNRAAMSSSWSDAYDGRCPAEYKLSTHWKEIREEHARLASQLALTVNKFEHSHSQFSKVLDLKNIELATQAYDLVLTILRAIGKWSARVQLILAWKYTHPHMPPAGAAGTGGGPSHKPGSEHGSSSSNGAGNGSKRTSSGSPSRPPSGRYLFSASNDSTHGADGGVAAGGSTEGYEYEQAIKNNFSKEELSMLVDVLSMIKSLASAMVRQETLFSPLVRFYMHHTTQQLLQGDLLPLLHRVDKRNRNNDLSALLLLRSAAADWTGGEEPPVNYKSYSRKQGGVVAVHPPRVVGLTPTQLYLLRSFLHHVSDENAPLRQRKSFLSSAEMESADVKTFDKFYAISYFFPSILNYNVVVKTLGDLSFLVVANTWDIIVGCKHVDKLLLS